MVCVGVVFGELDLNWFYVVGEVSVGGVCDYVVGDFLCGLYVEEGFFGEYEWL